MNASEKLLAAALALAICMPAARAQPRLSAWISGGIGLEERAAMAQGRDKFNLQLVFAHRASGAYLAQVDVLIGDEKGAVLLRTRTEGPFLYAQIRPGSYSIAATFRGKTQTRRVQVGEGRPAVIAMYWEEGE